MEELKLLGVLIEGGAFGLLCFVTVWITRWVPKRIERSDQVREAEARSREAVARETQQTINGILAAFAQQQKYERESCERMHKEALDSYGRQGREYQEAVERRYEDLVGRLDDLVRRVDDEHLLSREIRHTVGNLAQSEANRRALEELKQAPARGGSQP